MAAGTLLYVVFFEVLSREKDNRHSGIWQLLAILAGFLVMFALQVLSKFFVQIKKKKVVDCNRVFLPLKEIFPKISAKASTL